MGDDVITNSIIVLAAGFLVWGLWKSSQPRSVFTVRIVDGNPRAVSGKVTPAFLACVQEVVAANGVSRGSIKGYAHGQFIRLGFSREIPAGAQQQLRNWWAASGWSA